MAAPARRAMLLDHTLALIDEEGYAAASMEAIARRAGVTKPVVYDAFGSRGALLRALQEREQERAFAALGRALPISADGSTPEALLVDGLTSFLDAVREAPTAWRLILAPVETMPEPVRAHVEDGRATVLAQLQGLVVWGLPQLGLPEEDPELAARSLIALGETWARLVLADPEAFPPERVARFAAAFGSVVR